MRTFPFLTHPLSFANTKPVLLVDDHHAQASKLDSVLNEGMRAKSDVNSPGGYVFFPLVQNVALGNSSDRSERVAQMRGADTVISF